MNRNDDKVERSACFGFEKSNSINVFFIADILIIINTLGM